MESREGQLVKLGELVMRALYAQRVEGQEYNAQALVATTGLAQEQIARALEYASTRKWLILTETTDDSLPVGAELTDAGLQYAEGALQIRAQPESARSVVHNTTVSGANARINLNSIDNSTNEVRYGGEDNLFRQLEERLAAELPDPAQRGAMVAAVHELRAASDQKSRMAKFVSLTSSAAQFGANVVTAIQPFIEPLQRFMQS